MEQNGFEPPFDYMARVRPSAGLPSYLAIVS